MSGRMPILREDDIAEVLRKSIDDRHDLIAARHRKRAVRTKIVLHVDHDEDVAVAGCVSCGQFCLRFFLSSATALRQRSRPAKPTVNLLGERDQVFADLDRIIGVRLKPPQWFRQAFEIALGAGADFVKRGRGA